MSCMYLRKAFLVHLNLEWFTYSWPKWSMSWAMLVIEDTTWKFSPWEDPESPPPLPSTQDLVGALFEVAGAFLEKLCARYLRYLWWIAAANWSVWQKMLLFFCCGVLDCWVAFVLQCGKWSNLPSADYCRLVPQSLLICLPLVRSSVSNWCAITCVNSSSLRTAVEYLASVHWEILRLDCGVRFPIRFF